MNKELFSYNEDTLITNYLFNYIFNGEQLKIYRLAKLKLELIISPECNQNCKYCYIAKFGKDLYPLEERVNQTDTINNLKVLLSFLEDKKDNFWTRIFNKKEDDRSAFLRAIWDGDLDTIFSDKYSKCIVKKTST